MGRVDLPYLDVIPTRKRKYCYYRRNGKRTPLTDSQGRKLQPQDPELYAAWQRVHALYETGQAGPLPGTLGYLILAYLKSQEYAALADRTRSDYRKVLDWLRKAGDLPIGLLDTPTVVGIRDRAFTAGGWKFSLNAKAMISALWNWGLLHGLTKGDNPATPVPNLPRPKHLAEANRPWKPEELDAVLQVLPAGMAAAVALGAFAGMREGDCLALPWSAVADGQWIIWRQRKTGGTVEIPLHPALAAVLAVTPRTDDLIVTGTRGKPLSGSGFRAMFFRKLKALEADGKVGSGLTFHGLRHTAGTMLAEAGASQLAIQRWLGHADAKMTNRYTNRAEGRRLTRAALTLLEAPGDPSAK